MSIYDITIAGVTAASPSDGFIDPSTVFVYMNANPSDLPTSYANSLAKTRANRRHKSVVWSLQFYRVGSITNVTPSGTPSASTAPSGIVYRVDTGSGVPTVKDELNVGQTLTGAAAIKRMVARALCKAETVPVEVYDPTQDVAKGNSTQWARAGSRFNVETVGALYANITSAEAGITVTAV